ncbi:uroporphyrinogen-III C-methyltransferase [Corynebacterium aquatimens]|uniref:uroporphyrinogen-III C-methyltransferase n=1 Tax=Corynebacterium aquatimens TaxID=1190508 RepID=A0A931GSA6_9CORY|nr:uroporphyrinogen-III C-methyltransferase [Corynebacterium aquatimens]MBG6121857.1 uroporphyrin-III C-methyltransferase [Corynebacterium aquatimens]WJY65605.1 Uroporphyrinogen-III C-methyltransferase [Corynebacterium aquatimens]
MSAAENGVTQGTVTLVGGGPGEWDLITVRGLRALEAADVILTDHLGPTNQLDQFLDLTGKEIIDVAKLPYAKQVAQERINELLVEHARAGKRVARLKGGDPYVFGRGFEELQACAAAGVPCTVVPGVTSAVSVPAAAGVPVTQRGVTHAFTVVSGHLAPGDPRSLIDWGALARIGGTIVVIMGVRQVRAITQALMSASLAPSTPATVIQDGETPRQRAFRTTVAELADVMEREQVTNPAVYVIGEVAGLGDAHAG